MEKYIPDEWLYSQHSDNITQILTALNFIKDIFLLKCSIFANKFRGLGYKKDGE